ncbi:MAG: hypothetical protein R3264_10730 [Anaerolineae bacterium]|nr:hypothetical protein [Anaerolineae bacterium]
MLDWKTILFYVGFGLLLWGATILFQVQQDSDLAASFEITPTPTPTVAPTATSPRPTRVRIESGPDGCITTPWGGRVGYRPEAPFQTNLVPPGSEGKILIVSGTVYAADCRTPLAGAQIEIWHADADGSYQSSPFRARLITDSNGAYEFTTIKPLPYDAWDDVHPARIHYQVSYPGAPTVATQIFFDDDPVLKRRVTSSTQRALIRPVSTEIGPNGKLFRTTFDISLMIDPPE